MKQQRILAILGFVLAAGAVPAQQPAGDTLPARAFMRIGTSKLRHGSPILSLAYSPDGEILAAGGGMDPLRLWDPRTGALLRELNEPMVQAIAFTLSGENMVYASLQKNVRVWNFKLNKETAKFEGHKAPVKAIAIPPDTSVIASGSQDGAIFLWDWNTKRKLEELHGHTDEVTALVYTPDNNLLISAGSDRVIHFWSTETSKSTRKLDAGCGVLALAVSADSKTLYSAGDDNLIRRWNIAAGQQTGTFQGHEGIVVSLILQGDTLVSGALDRTIRFWDVKTTALLRTLPRRQGDCDALALTKKGDFVASAGSNGVIRIFEAASGKEVILSTGPQAGLTSLLLTPNQRLAATTLDGQILVWNAQTGQMVRAWDSKQQGEILLARSPDGKTLATASDVVRFWNPDTGTEVGQLPATPGDAIVALAFGPDSRTIAVGRRSSQIELWHGAEKKLVRSLKHAEPLHALAWSPNGQYLATGGWGKITIWDAKAGMQIKSFDVKEGPAPVFPQVASLVFGPDNRTLAVAGFDALVRVYDMQASNPTAEKEQIVCEGHLSMPYAVTFAPDGRTILTGSFDKTVRLWEAFSGRQIAQFKGHVGPVLGVAFASDGRSVYSAGADAVIYRWDVPGLQGNGKLPEVTLSPQEIEESWKTLASEDTPRGHETLWRCVASAKQSVPALTSRIYLLDPEKVTKLFKELDSNQYTTRMAAMSALSGYGRWMEGRYDAAMANPASLEYKRRVEKLKEKLNAANSESLTQERLRVRRLMMILEQVRSPEAIDTLQKLAERAPEEKLREEAKGALSRLRLSARTAPSER